MKQSRQVQEGQAQEEEKYESLSSHSSLEEMANENNTRSNLASKEAQSYIAKSISFPERPQQYQTLFEIYKNNTEKLKKLRQQVITLEDTILDDLRLKQSKKDVQLCIEGILQMDMDDYKIEDFNERRVKRKVNLNKINELYESLKKMIKIQDFLMSEDNRNKMVEKIKNFKEILSYRLHKDYLSVVIRCFKELKLDKEISQQKSIQESGIFLAESRSSEEYHTIVIFNFNSLLHWLSPKIVHFQLEEENIMQQLEKTKEQALMYLNMAKKITIFDMQKITIASYCHAHQLILVYQSTSKLRLFNLLGVELMTIQLDLLDQLILIEMFQKQLVLGTKDGLVRVYKIMPKFELVLIKIFMCYWKDLTEVNCYRCVGTQRLQKIFFSVSNRVCEFDLKTSLVTQSYQIEQESWNFILKHKHKLQNLIQPLLFTNKNERIASIQKLKSYLSKEKCKLSEEKKLIHLQVKKNPEEKETPYQLLLADNQGFLELMIV